MNNEPEIPINSVSSDDRTMAMLAYLLGFFTSWLGPLILYFVKKDTSRFVAFHALQSLFFQGAILVLTIAGASTLHIIGWGVISVLNIIGCIVAGMAANRGEWYELPVLGEFARKQTGQ